MRAGIAPLVVWTEKGLYCPDGGFHIDPCRAVDTAVITHAHSDHARKGSGRYLCAASSTELLKVRLGGSINVTGVPYRESFRLGKVFVSFHSAGHILGSAQVRIQRSGEIWVVSGDYKRDPDPSCDPFEPVPCDTFVTEATFGTPSHIWRKDADHGRDIHEWWMRNAVQGKNSILFGYSLGKAQRILAELVSRAERPVLIHDSISGPTEVYRREGRALAPTRELSSLEADQEIRGELILAPPSILGVGSDWSRRFGHFQTAFASGWMKGSSWIRPGSYDHGFVISDHADWEDLNRTVDETGASRVFIQHRGNGALLKHLRKRGLDAHPASSLTEENYARIAGTTLSLF